MDIDCTLSVRLASGESIQQIGIGETRSADGFLCVRVHELDPGAAWSGEIFSRRPAFHESHPDATRPFDIESVQLGAPAGVAPTWHPFDGTDSVDDPTQIHTGLMTYASLWWVLRPGGPYPVHAKIPPSHAYQLDGRRSLYFSFGHPGREVPARLQADAGLEEYLGRRPGGFVTGDVNVDNFVGLWDGDLGRDAFNYTPGSSTAAQWWAVPHDIYPWAFQAPRGIYYLGSTAGADGSGPNRRGGESARYAGPLWMLTSGDADDRNLALIVLRHVAAMSFEHRDPDPGGFVGQHEAQRRSEKSTGDFPGDDKIPWKSHNWLEDLIAGAAYFPGDPVISRAARDGLEKVLKTGGFWARRSGSRVVDRALSALNAGACFAKGTPLGDRCFTHLPVIVDQMLSQVGDDPYIMDDGLYPGSTADVLGGAVTPWMDGGVIKRVIEAQRILGRTLWHDKLMEMLEFYIRNGVLHHPVTVQYRSYERTHPRGTCAYFGFPNLNDMNDPRLPTSHNGLGWTAGLDGGTYALPSWAAANNAWLITAFAYLGDHRPEHRPLIKDVFAVFAAGLAGDFRSIGGNIAAKKCGELMVGAHDTNAILTIKGW